MHHYLPKLIRICPLNFPLPNILTPFFFAAAEHPFGRHDYQQPVVYPQRGPDGIAYNKPPENKGKLLPFIKVAASCSIIRKEGNPM